ncbi:aldo/keto reductase (plasmid) [Bacillus sp. 31A1R]|uniref:Aldo/keto reductase n=1 Tax=Robertmurraya mangrovi TaxID=3098077 RepID=A0ABU5IVD8_9BACI|nr:aldo/keto reductase [Bacillus sp. 31A1R]MDZ5471123.1 aldo/keto reductase [Bacillus sp. 31A1R]
MEKRKLGKSDLMISELGLGCMSLGTDETRAQKIIEAALEEGINYFDTADLYDYGINEKIVGDSLKAVRDKVIIATKVGNKPNQTRDGWTWDPSKAYIKEAVKQSLKRLQTDYIDLYQLHGGTLEDPMEATIEAFDELVNEGIIRYYGISSIRPNVIREYVSNSNIVSVMMQYSLLDRRPEETVLPLLNQNHISVVARGPLAKGLLSNKSIEKASESIIEKGYLDYSFTEIEELVSTIQSKMLENRSFTELALQYVLSQPSVSSVIAGASSIEQVKDNATAVKRSPLSEDEISLLKEISKENFYLEHR